jgi:hypothetical protein
MPQYFQGVMGTSAEGSGIRLRPVMGGLLAGLLPAEVVTQKIGAKLTIAAGFAVLGAGLGLGLAGDLGIRADIVERARDNRDDDRAGLGAAWARIGEVMALAGRDSADDEPDDQQHRSDAHYYLRERQAG